MAKLSPSTDTDTSSIPTQSGFVWGLIKPEVTMVEELKTVFFVENGLMFTTMYAIVTANADVVIAIQSFQHVVELDIQHFLCTENVGRHKVHLVANDLATLLPHFALDAIVPVLVADVIGANEHFLGRKL